VIDLVGIVVRSGKGGDGAISFRREKFVPFGGPDGGDGGDGGDVAIRADDTVTDLRRFKRNRLYKAADGRPGMRRKKHGRKGEDLILAVPVGTVVSYKTDVAGDAFIADLEKPGQLAVVAVGGKGGNGNIHFASSTNQAPEIAQQGEPGVEHSIILEMRLIADVGIIGYPNVGKSTLLAAASAAQPKIAGYPFTTLEPTLGAVEVGRKSFVMAEIPGLIADAHLGRGLGHDFLRHVMRTKILIHLVDASSDSPVDEMAGVNAELGLFDSSLAQKPQLVAVNKIDLPEAQARLGEIRKAFAHTGCQVLYISAATGEGVTGLMAAVASLLERVTAEKESIKLPGKVFHPMPRVSGVSVRKEGDTFVMVVPGLERITTRDGKTGPEVYQQLKRYLIRQGVNRELRKAGVKPGDKVRCGALEWEW